MKNLILIVCLLTITSCGGGGGGVGGGGNNSKDLTLYRNINFLEVGSVTPKGASVRSYKVQPAALLNAIDAGLDETFRIASNPPYNYHVAWNRYTVDWGFSRHNRYRVWILAQSPKCENPAFLMEYRGTEYDQTEYDKDPRIGFVALCAAGAYRHFNNGSTAGGNVLSPAMVITDDAATAVNASRFEAEHGVYDEMDPVKFAATQYHATGGHPIMPDPNSGQISENRVHTVSAVIDGTCFILTK